MKIYLLDRNQGMIDAWKKRFYTKDFIIGNGSPMDVITLQVAAVSPANSFGFMDGGIDRHYRDHFPGIEEAVRKEILREHGGEMPVGASLYVRHGACSWIIAPTMRVPMDVSKTINAYLAFRAALLLARDIGVDVACPGLCTGVGGMTHEECARQMQQAYNRVIHGFSVASLADNAPHEEFLETGHYPRNYGRRDGR